MLVYQRLIEWSGWGAYTLLYHIITFITYLCIHYYTTDNFCSDWGVQNADVSHGTSDAARTNHRCHSRRTLSDFSPWSLVSLVNYSNFWKLPKTILPKCTTVSCRDFLHQLSKILAKKTHRPLHGEKTRHRRLTWLSNLEARSITAWMICGPWIDVPGE